MGVTTNSVVVQTGLSVPAGGQADTSVVDLSAKYGGRVLVHCTYSAVDATTGLVVDVHTQDQQSTPKWTTEPIASYSMPGIAGRTTLSVENLPPGKYRLTLTNRDATNGATVDVVLVEVDIA